MNSVFCFLLFFSSLKYYTPLLAEPDLSAFKLPETNLIETSKVRNYSWKKENGVHFFQVNGGLFLLVVGFFSFSQQT
jgi:hypothetical protein